ncbi:hypothetical protein PVAP13_2NG614301 [Panicum virgatum]|uniref:Uncharacterized protein n=1 Tax=Panicum virgatum TaxID=38727 RepID=A0A8T0VSW5_PANVG|nr:hypothetical protein PVAP13_2NG614301 [Panicum virgatum]
MINHRPLHINPASVLPENSCSQDTKVDTPPLLASPPMHQCQIMKITELSGPATNSYEAWSEPILSDMDMQIHGRLTQTEKQSRVFSIAREQRFHLVAAIQCQIRTQTNIAMQTRPMCRTQLRVKVTKIACIMKMSSFLRWNVTSLPKHPLPEVACHDRLRVYAKKRSIFF